MTDTERAHQDAPHPDWGVLWIAAAGLVAAIAAGSRAAINYGLDGDCIRGVMAAQALIADGVYIPSRLPGNPAFEYLLAGLSLLDGPVLTNGVMFLFFCVAAVGFAVVARVEPHRTLLVCLFCLTPILLVNSATTIDYIPGLAALIWSYAAVKAERPGIAGLLLALAVGCRLSNVLFAIPLGLYLLLSGAGTLRSIVVPAVGSAVGLLFYAPVLARNGLAAMAVPPHAYHGFSYVLFTGYKFLMVFGPIATVGIAIVLAIHVPKVIGVNREALTRRDAAYTAELAAVAVFVLLFLRHSDESDYLVPAIPFCYLLLGRWLGTRSLAVVAALVVSFSFVSIELKGGESGHRHITAKPAAGIVIKDYLDRKELEALRLGTAKIDLPERSVVLHGYGPMLGFENPGLHRVDARSISSALDERGIADPLAIHRVAGREIYLVSGLSAANVSTLRREGYRIYYFSESAPSQCKHSWGYDPQEIGLTRLDVFGDNAFYRKL